MSVNNWIIFFVFSLFLSSAFVQAQEKILVDEIIAVVGDKIVLKSNIEEQYWAAINQGMEDDGLRCQILDQLLLEKMFVTHAEIDSLEVSEEEVESEIDRRMDYFLGLFGGDEQKFEDYYDKTVLQMKEEFRDDVKDLLLAQRMQGKVLSDIKVTPKEVKTFFNQIPRDSLPYFNAEIEMGHLVIKPELTKTEKEGTIARLAEIKKQIEEGADFGDMAKKFSEGPSGPQGGDLGFIGRGQMVPEFEGAAFRLRNPGDISGTVETKFGFHIVQLLERRGDKIHVRHILLRPKISYQQLEDAQTQLDSIRTLIMEDDSLTFQKAVEKFSDDEATKKTGGLIVSEQSGSSVYDMNQLDPNDFFAIEELKEGEISEPIKYQTKEGDDAYRILYLYSRTSPHVANLKDDYSKVQKIVKSNKQNETLINWLDRKVKRTYIFVNEEYKDCTMMEKWIN
ncbi:MAG: peptidylprolyl isomerase [Chitinophagales bacterium]